MKKKEEVQKSVPRKSYQPRTKDSLKNRKFFSNNFLMMRRLCKCTIYSTEKIPPRSEFFFVWLKGGPNLYIMKFITASIPQSRFISWEKNLLKFQLLCKREVVSRGPHFIENYGKVGVCNQWWKGGRNWSRGRLLQKNIPFHPFIIINESFSIQQTKIVIF